MLISFYNRIDTIDPFSCLNTLFYASTLLTCLLGGPVIEIRQHFFTEILYELYFIWTSAVRDTTLYNLR